MARITFYVKCPQCNGTQFYEPSTGEGSQPIPCTWPGCTQGFIESGGCILNPSSEELMAKCNAILAKCEEILAEVSGG
jgi:phage FluMu protein Com